MTSKRRTIVIGAILAVVLGGGVLAWQAWQQDSRLATAVALAPGDSQRLSWTDWSGVREELGADLTGAGPEEVEAFLDRGYDADLTSTSAVLTSATALQEQWDLSPADLEWELLAQAVDGQVVLLGPGEDFDYEAFRERLRAAGYVEPDEEGGTWQAGEGELAELGLPPEVGSVRVDEDAGVVATSEVAAYLAQWDEELREDDVDEGVADVVGAYDEVRALSAVVYTGDQACGELAMSQADGADNARADQLIADAGEIHPLRGYGMAALPGDAVRVAMAFESDDQARTDADTRSTLAAGDAPGQGGTFPDRFRLGEVSARGNVVRMELAPTEGSYVLSDLSSGPVLFATC
ncbi:hypothetical protein KUV85_16525 [Nocardioides panacisoli]|uniref:hypothetical protein n=1 Tax=Nocardioides panacisoli TaxID=627624 RepID=UPI001C628315|nr:hypothetical protein [Nocardioides panacisoli]QYJ03905.1 hypothetical protein KUV85_16525 [Nocardioides panacisoli]